MDKMPRKTFRTSDGTTLGYISADQGNPSVMLHGWSQSAEQFNYQMESLDTVAELALL